MVGAKDISGAINQKKMPGLAARRTWGRLGRCRSVGIGFRVFLVHGATMPRPGQRWNDDNDDTGDNARPAVLEKFRINENCEAVLGNLCGYVVRSNIISIRQYFIKGFY